MCKCSDAVLVAVSIFAAACCAAAQARAPFGFGKPVSAQEIAGWDIDVRPDGKGLPRGKGSVAQGQELYDAKCASCHGTFGESNQYLALAGGVGTLASDQPVRTTGSKLNYATTLFDYIRRAMPFANPQSLAPDEVYALTAYVLNLNDILSADATLTATSPSRRAPSVRPRRMPARRHRRFRRRSSRRNPRARRATTYRIASWARRSARLR